MRPYVPWVAAGGAFSVFGAVLAAFVLAALARYDACVTMVPHTTGCGLPSPGTTALASIFLVAGIMLIFAGVLVHLSARRKALGAPGSNIAP